jgi:UDP-N-acetylmuramoylalanine--D-glutamate ligase
MSARYRGRRAVVLGLGMTGLSLARFLVRQGADVRVADTRSDPPNRAALAAELPSVRIEPGLTTTQRSRRPDRNQPGVDPREPRLRRRCCLTEIVGDIELCARARRTRKCWRSPARTARRPLRR